MLSLNLEVKAVNRCSSTQQVRQKLWHWSRIASTLSQWPVLNDGCSVCLKYNVQNRSDYFKCNFMSYFISDTCATQRNFIWWIHAIIISNPTERKEKSSNHLQSHMTTKTRAQNNHYSSFIVPLKKEYGSRYETSIREKFLGRIVQSLPIPINDVCRLDFHTIPSVYLIYELTFLCEYLS